MNSPGKTWPGFLPMHRVYFYYIYMASKYNINCIISEEKSPIYEKSTMIILGNGRKKFP